MKNSTVARPQPRRWSYEQRETPRRYPLLDCSYQPSEGSRFGNGCPEKADNSFKRRSIRDISGEFSENEKRWSFLIELFLFAVIVAITIGALSDMTHALRFLGN